MLAIMTRLVLGVVVMAAGFWLVIKTEWFLSNFGRIEFFESKLATSGGTRLGYKIFGLIFIVLGALIASGLIGEFLAWLTSPLTKYN